MGSGGGCRHCLFQQSRHSDTSQEVGVILPPCAKADGLRLDDLFLGIGGVILVETYIVATVIVKWVRALNAALAEGDLLYVLENAPKLVRYWYSSIATYIFSVVCP